MMKRNKGKIDFREAICFLEQFRRATCSSSPAFKESLEGSKSYGALQTASPETPILGQMHFSSGQSEAIVTLKSTDINIGAPIIFCVQGPKILNAA